MRKSSGWRTRSRWGILGLLLPAAMMLTAVPGLAQWDWNQAYGNIGNSSFVNVETHIGVVPLWSVPLGGAVAWGGPAMGEGGTVYLGTTNGTFFAFRPNGSLRCSVSFPDRVYTSTPAVLPGGEVAVLFQRMAEPGMQGFLSLLSADCKTIWEVELARWHPEVNSVASGSVKVWTLSSTGTSFLFVHGRNTRQADATGPGLLTRADLLVYTTDGQLFARHPVGEICLDVGGGVGAFDFGDIWDYLWPTAGSVPPLYEQFGWPDSTPAIMDSAIRGYSSPSQPLVAVTGGCAKLDVFRFRPAADAMSDRLVSTWSTRVDHSEALLSSPAVTPEGQVVIGTSTHRLKVFDLGTQRLKWEADTKHPVMHPPSMAPGVWFTISEFKGWLIDPDTGELVPTARVQPMDLAGTLAASAASRTQAFIPNFSGLEVWSHDLLNLAHPLRDDDFLTSNPAVTPGGRVYVVGQTKEEGVLFAFGPP